MADARAAELALVTADCDVTIGAGRALRRGRFAVPAPL
jgi:hypothetical protein